MDAIDARDARSKRPDRPGWTAEMELFPETGPASMTDTERETAIALAREDMQQYALRQDWEKAHAAQERMRTLIRKRTQEQVARMETEQGLSVR
jgi:hypothetical protein